MRLLAYGAASTLAASYVVLSAFLSRPNGFSAAVYLSKSNACMMILWNFGVFLTVLAGKFLQTIFFGQLRSIEFERLHERCWYAVTESLLALTIFREEFDTSFIILFVSLLFLKVFHWLASDRIEMMEQTQNITKLFHCRMVAILSTLCFVDGMLVYLAAESVLLDGPSVMIMFASEYMILFTTAWAISFKYAVNVYDIMLSRRSPDPWDSKSIYIFYIELAADFFKLTTYIVFFGLILTFYGLPLNILRDVYMTARSFYIKVRDLIRFRKATRNMDERYPNATPQEMTDLADKTCIICREDMVVNADPQHNARPKKLPCGHIFHFNCLRSWLERQQSCPTCRRSVLTENPAPTPTQPIVRPPPPAPGQAPNAQHQNAMNALANDFLARQAGRGGNLLQVPPNNEGGSRSSSSSRRRDRTNDDNPLANFTLPPLSAPGTPAPQSIPLPGTSPLASPAPTPSALPEPTKTTPAVTPNEEITSDAKDFRSIALAAAMRRNPPLTRTTSSPPSTTNEAELPKLDKGKARAVEEPRIQPASGPSKSRVDLPRLIPLFDPARRNAPIPQVDALLGVKTSAQVVITPKSNYSGLSKSQEEVLESLASQSLKQKLEALEDTHKRLFELMQDVRALMESVPAGDLLDLARLGADNQSQE